MSRRFALNGLFALAGAALLLSLFSTVDLRACWTALVSVGWGIVAVSVYRFVPLALDTCGWRAQLPDANRPALPALLLIRWVTESVNALLPVAQVGGDVVRARLTYRLGVAGPEAVASVVVDYTVSLLVQALFTLICVGIALAITGRSDAALPLTLATLFAALLFFGFLIWQRHGGVTALGNLSARLLGRDGLQVNAGRVDAAMQRLYRRLPDLLTTATWHGAGWVARSGEVWLVFAAMGEPIGIGVALAVEGLSFAARSAAFAVPGALGAQEAGIFALALLFGLPFEQAAVLAVVKRLRELLVGLPALLVWWRIELRPGPASAAGT